MHKNSLLFFLVLTGCASAQIVSFGVEGGVPFTDRTYRPDESRPYIVGPAVEFHLPARFALKVEALYQRIGTESAFFNIPAGPSTSPTFVVIPPGASTGGVSLFNRERGNLWEFPLLGEYYFRPKSARWQPYIETGWVLRSAWIHDNGSQTTAGSPPVSFKDSFRTPLDVGAAGGAGVKIPLRRFTLSPEVRYTRWGTQDSVLRKNEASFLLGFRF